MTEKLNQQSKEIDLVELFSNLWRGIMRFFGSIIDFFLFLFVFGIRRIHWMTIIFIAGIGIGFIVYSQTPRYYSSEMIAQPNGFTSIDMAEYINDIHNMCERSNIEGLTNALNLSPEIVKLIKDIEAFFYIDVNMDGISDQVDYKNNYDPEDTTKAIIQSRILIRAEVLGNDIFYEVKEGLIRYIDNNPYLIKVNDLRKRELTARIKQAEQEIRKLDSLQNFEYYKNLEDGSINREGQIVFLNEKVTQLYYLDKTSLLSKSIEYQNALELSTEPITIIKDFTSLQAEENPLIGYLIRFGFLVGFIGYITLLCYAYRKKIIDFLSSKG